LPTGIRDSIVVASTTSTPDCGPFGYLLPLFKAKTGIEVKVVAQGTGEALVPPGEATLMWCSYTPGLPCRKSSPRASA
jgi:ABC-type tungstate transport system permease subunit